MKLFEILPHLKYTIQRIKIHFPWIKIFLNFYYFNKKIFIDVCLLTLLRYLANLFSLTTHHSFIIVITILCLYYWGIIPIYNHSNPPSLIYFILIITTRNFNPLRNYFSNFFTFFISNKILQDENKKSVKSKQRFTEYLIPLH